MSLHNQELKTQIMITEQSNPRTLYIDRMSTLEMLQTINDEDRRVALAVQEVIPRIAEAVDAIVTRMEKGGRMIYVGAGTSGRLGVLDAVQRGVNRPGALEREIEGISSKVLSERLKKLTHFQVLERQEFPEIPPRVEYALTHRGQKLVSLLEAINRLARDW